MSRSLRFVALGASTAFALSAATFANAQGTRAEPEASAEARLAWAKRHVELVCRPLEARQMFDRATRCYNDVARLVGDANKSLPSTTAAKPAPAPATATSPAAAPAATAARPAAPAPAAARPAAPAATASRPAAPAATRPATNRPAVRTAAVRPAPARPAPARTRLVLRQASPSVSEAGPLFSPAPPASRRCSGVGCLQYTLLGVGF